MDGNSVALSRHIRAPLERVWQALVDPAQARTWFAAKANIDPELGGAYELFWRPDTPESQSTIGCRITAIAPCRYLAFTWRGPDELAAPVLAAVPARRSPARRPQLPAPGAVRLVIWSALALIWERLGW